MKTAKYKLPYNIKNTEYKNGFIYIELNKPKEIIIKTAMQEFFMVLKEFNKELYNTMYNEGILDTAIEKEKEQIIEVGNSCALNHHIWQSKMNNMPKEWLERLDAHLSFGEEYYNQTYNQDK